MQYIKQCNDLKKEEYQKQQKIKQQLKKIKYKIAIISGKGGVGKSTVTEFRHGFRDARQKSWGYRRRHSRTLYTKDAGAKKANTQRKPQMEHFHQLQEIGNKSVASMDFLLKNNETPVIWRGPLKMKLIQRFLSDINWGELNFSSLICPLELEMNR